MPRPFAKGNKLAKGGKRDGAGRKSNEVLAAEKLAEETFESICRKSTLKLAKHFVNRAFKSDTVLNKAADKFWPDKRDEQIPTSQTIQFIQFNISNNDPPQLQAEAIPVTVLASDGNSEASGASLAQACRQGQNGIEFHDFEDVS